MSKKRPNSAAAVAADRFRPAAFFLPGLVLFLFTALTTINAIKIPALLALIVTALALLGCMQQLRQRLTWIVAAVALFVVVNGISTLYSVSGQFALQDFLPIACAFCVFVLILAFEPGQKGLIGRRAGGMFAVSTALASLLSIDQLSTRWLSSPGPIIFRQKRVGLNKKPFYMYKFRSMRVNASSDTGWSTNSDPRKTRFGSFIRKFSIDELPQFFNVLKGDMSLVGPRPELPHFVDQFKEEIPLYMVKHQVRPGITGWAQVNGLRGDTSIKERIEHDVYYIENWSILLDIKILFLTLFKGFVNQEKLN